MTNPTSQPLDLDAIETRAAHLHEYGDPTDTRQAGWEALAGEDVPALVAEVRRLREQLARRVQCNDCGAVGTVFTGDDGRAYLDPSGQIWHGSAPAAG